METVVEENPALGWRAIRLGWTVPGCCAARFARCCAGGGRALKIMFPMISDVAEFDQAGAIVERELIICDSTAIRCRSAPTSAPWSRCRRCSINSMSC